MVLTLDALHTTKKAARLVHGNLHTHYAPILKANQPLTSQAVSTTRETGSGTYFVIDLGGGSRVGQDAFAQEVEVRPAIHLPLGRLDAVDLALDWT